MWLDAVADTRTVDLASNQPRFLEDLQMLRDGGLREVEPVDNLAANALVVAGEQPKDLDARRYAPGLPHLE